MNSRVVSSTPPLVMSDIKPELHEHTVENQDHQPRHNEAASQSSPSIHGHSPGSSLPLDDEKADPILSTLSSNEEKRRESSCSQLDRDKELDDQEDDEVEEHRDASPTRVHTAVDDQTSTQEAGLTKTQSISKTLSPFQEFLFVTTICLSQLFTRKYPRPQTPSCRLFSPFKTSFQLADSIPLTNRSQSRPDPLRSTLRLRHLQRHRPRRAVLVHRRLLPHRRHLYPLFWPPRRYFRLQAPPPHRLCLVRPLLCRHRPCRLLQPRPLHLGPRPGWHWARPVPAQCPSHPRRYLSAWPEEGHALFAVWCDCPVSFLSPSWHACVRRPPFPYCLPRYCPARKKFKKKKKKKEPFS